MNRYVLGLIVLSVVGLSSWSDDGGAFAQRGAGGGETVIREQLASYIEVFNRHDASAVGGRWAADGVSVDLETGERTTGREALVERFAAFFAKNPSARLIGRVDTVRLIRPDVALAEGTATLMTGDEAIESVYSAVLVKEQDQWLISSSHERDVPSPPTSYDALRGLEWLVGTWQDQTDDVTVVTTARWSVNRAFLIRSFSAQFADGAGSEGTQVIGWDPLGKQIRTWTFNSDGSFAEGTAAKNGNEWMVKLSHVLSDGRLAAGTQVISRIDDDTITVQTIGQTVDGEPVPASEPVTVVRTGGSDAVSATDAPVREGGTR
ncbi:MAG: SgcJ/EcaC family oxidoreductase [Planctomycetaceae bacterium]